VAAAAGTAWFQRKTLLESGSWVTSHLEFVGALWKEEALRERMDNLLDLGTEMGCGFHWCDHPFTPQLASSELTVQYQFLHTARFPAA
jgi:hypothetical protein